MVFDTGAGTNCIYRKVLPPGNEELIKISPSVCVVGAGGKRLGIAGNRNVTKILLQKKFIELLDGAEVPILRSIGRKLADQQGGNFKEGRKARGNRHQIKFESTKTPLSNPEPNNGLL
eukprot:IDg16282t1